MNLFESANMFMTWEIYLANTSLRSIESFFLSKYQKSGWWRSSSEEVIRRRSWRWIGKRRWCSGAEETILSKHQLVWKKILFRCWLNDFSVMHDSAIKKYLLFLIVLMFALLPKIYSIVFKKECSMSALNKLPF